MPDSRPSVEEVTEALRRAFPRQPWWWRLRRRVAFKVGLDWRMPTLGYLIDVDRDRHSR